MKRMYKLVAIVIVFIIVSSIIIPNSVSASQINSIENKENTNNILSSKWDSMFGLERINVFKYEDNRYFAKSSTNAAMQQIIDLRDYENNIDNNNMFIGFGMNVIAHKEVEVYINVDFYNEIPSEVNYEEPISTNRIYKKVNPTKDVMTSLFYNMTENNIVGNQNHEYTIPAGARHARFTIRAHSNTKEFSVNDKLDIELNNIMFEVRDLNYNLEVQAEYSEAEIEMYDSEVSGFISVVNMTDDWAPSAKLTMNIISDMVKEVILPNGVVVTQDTDYYVTSNGVFAFEVTLENGVKVEKIITVDTIDNISSILHVNYNQEEKSNKIAIDAFDTDSGVKEIRYAWSEKETKPFEYERLSLDHIEYKNDYGVWYLHIIVEDFAGNLTQYTSNEMKMDFKPTRKHREIDSVVEKQVKDEDGIDYREVASSGNGYFILKDESSIANSYIADYLEDALETMDASEQSVTVIFGETGPPGAVIDQTLQQPAFLKGGGLGHILIVKFILM